MSNTNGHWPHALRRYLLTSIALHGLWEALQLPLYTIWYDEPRSKQILAVLHCTIGDAMIAGLALLLALALAASLHWPAAGFRRTLLITLAFGIAYTIYSEWMNVNVRGSWRYSPLMPTLPWLGTGLSPLLQWAIVPLFAFGTINRRMFSTD